MSQPAPHRSASACSCSMTRVQGRDKEVHTVNSPLLRAAARLAVAPGLPRDKVQHLDRVPPLVVAPRRAPLPKRSTWRQRLTLSQRLITPAPTRGHSRHTKLLKGASAQAPGSPAPVPLTSTVTTAKPPLTSAAFSSRFTRSTARPRVSRRNGHRSSVARMYLRQAHGDRRYLRLRTKHPLTGGQLAASHLVWKNTTGYRPEGDGCVGRRTSQATCTPSRMRTYRDCAPSTI